MIQIKIKNWVKITEDGNGVDNLDNEIKFKTSMLKLSLCDDAHWKTW